MFSAIVKYRAGYSLGLVLFATALFTPAARANLILDGGFETPVVGPGGFQSGFQTFTVGQTFGTGNPWLVIGSTNGNVAVYPSSETIGSPPTALNVQEGVQAIDLTGNTDNGSATGISQSFATTVGQLYQLSFYVGELDNQSASILVDLNGSLFQTSTNNAATSGQTTLWSLFTYDFTATGTSTSLSFINNSASGTALNGLDAIDVEPVTASAAPEPSMAILLAGGIGLLAFVRSRRSSAQA